MSQENVADSATEEPKEENTENAEGGEIVDEKGDEKVEGGEIEDDKGETAEKTEDEQVAGEHAEGEEVQGEEKGEGEQEEGKEVLDGEQAEGGKGYELKGEEYGEENLGEQQGEEEQAMEEQKEEEGEEEQPEYEEEPVDPAAPLNLSDSREAVRGDYELQPEQLAQVEKLWDLYQDFTPAYTKINQFITTKELVYMLSCLFLMTYTEEQLMELVTFVCRPPDDPDHITYEQFLRMVKIRWRDLSQEEELRAALRFLDPGKTGEVEADELRDVLGKLGNKLPPKIIENLIKEIDIGGEGKIGIEDVVAIVGMELMSDDMLQPKENEEDEEAA